MINKNDYHYVLRRIITFLIISALSFFLFQSCAKASTLAPATLQYYKPDRVNAWTRSPVNNNLLNENYYNTSVGDPNEIRAIYGLANNQISGSLFSFSLLKGQPVPTISAKIQFIDASWFNCDIETDVVNYADGSIYVAKCDLSGTGSKQVYKYGFEWSDSSGYYMSENSVYISKINAFSDANAYTSYITNVNNNINTVNNQLTDIKYQNERIISAEEETKDAINDLNDSINADYQSDTSWYSDFEGVTGNNTNYLKTLLLYPTTLLISIANSVINNTCSQIDLGTLWGVHLYLPCIDWKSYVGNAIYISIDTIMGIAVLFGIITYIRKLFIYVADFGMSAYETVGVEVFK